MLRKESERALLESIRRRLALPMAKRTNFLRVRLPGGGCQGSAGASPSHGSKTGTAAGGVARVESLRYVEPMITAKQVRELLQAKPFRPFRICMSDGTHYDITNHDMAFVGRNTVEVGLNLDPDGFAEYFARCSILHITKLEDLPETIAR
jgi:hypothetical protein